MRILESGINFIISTSSVSKNTNLGAKSSTLLAVNSGKELSSWVVKPLQHTIMAQTKRALGEEASACSSLPKYLI
jgi:hypothetical protein